MQSKLVQYTYSNRDRDAVIYTDFPDQSDTKKNQKRRLWKSTTNHN